MWCPVCTRDTNEEMEQDFSFEEEPGFVLSDPEAE
jgi:hypothetical protein